MLSANYVRHLKVLGKFCYTWDTASADQTAMQLNLVRMYDQMATGETPSLPVLIDQSPNFNTLNNAIISGPAQMKSTLVNMTSTYLINSDFTDDLVSNTPTNLSSATAVLIAWQLETASDSITFTTQASTGQVGFFENNYTLTGSFQTAADGSATYKDSIYVVATIV